MRTTADQTSLDTPREVFVDSSGLFAAYDARDLHHHRAGPLLDRLMVGSASLITTNYILVEVAAVLQRRLGEDPARRILTELSRVSDVVWVDEDLHRRGLEAWLAVGRKSLSLVDCVSFALMHELHLDVAFAFDRHFEEQGFRLL